MYFRGGRGADRAGRDAGLTAPRWAGGAANAMDASRAGTWSGFDNRVSQAISRARQDASKVDLSCRIDELTCGPAATVP